MKRALLYSCPEIFDHEDVLTYQAAIYILTACDFLT